MPTTITTVATSDVLESIFSKYKRFSARCPLKDFRQMLLTIPLSTMNLTCDVVKQALETVSGIDLEEWLRHVFGQSTLSKRKAVFSAFIYDMHESCMKNISGYQADSHQSSCSPVPLVFPISPISPISLY